MDAMVMLVMAVLAWITLQSGMVFLTLVVVAAMLILLMGEGGSSAPAKSGGGGGGGQQPIIIQTAKGAEWPKKTNWQFRPNWKGDKDGEEYIGVSLAAPIILMGKILKSFLLMLKPKGSG